MVTTLKTPTLPPINAREDNGSNRPEWFRLEVPTQIEYVTGEVGERDAYEAWLAVGPEGLEAKQRGEREKRREYNRLRAEVLPPKECELTLTREQAFALIIGCYCRASGAGLSEQSTFTAEIEALLCV